MKLEHIGIAVDDAAAVAALYALLFGHQPYKAETVAEQGVRTHFVSAETAKLELLEALGPDSPVAKYLEKRGPGLHHLAFEVPDIDAHFEQMRALGLQPLGSAPSAGADGKRIFFLHPKQTHGVLIEFCQSIPTPLAPTRLTHHGAGPAVYELGSRENPTLLVLPPPGTAIFPTLEMLLRRLEPHLHVLTLDVQSGSTASEGVAAVFSDFAVEKAHLLGLGVGCAAALEVAAQQPERVQKLLLHAPPPGIRGTDRAVLLSLNSQAANDLSAFRALLPNALPVLLPADEAAAFVPDPDLFVPLCLHHLSAS